MGLSTSITDFLCVYKLLFLIVSNLSIYANESLHYRVVVGSFDSFS